MTNSDIAQVPTEERAHTPGPWQIGDESKRESPLMVYCDDALGSRVADCSTSGHGITTAQDRANARLIAAAPEMFELLKKYAYDGRLQSFSDREGFRKDALALIAKAEGRS